MATRVSSGFASFCWWRVASVLLGTAYGIWKEYELNNKVWRVVDQQHLARAKPTAAPVADSRELLRRGGRSRRACA